MNGVKSQPPELPPPATFRASGKLVIVAILAVAFWAATTSWYFRYRATHRAAKFWGSEAATLIRDAPSVIVQHKPFAGSDPVTIQASFNTSEIDVSHAHGLTHLRNALLEDQSFDWTTADKPLPFWPDEVDVQHWWLTFTDPTSSKDVTIWISNDFNWASRGDDENKGHSISTAPIAAGLREMFAEFAASPATQSPEPSR